MAPERIWKLGVPIWREAPEIFFCRAPPLFGSKSTISRFGERFRDGQYSLVSLLFAVLLLTVLPIRAQQFVKVGMYTHALWSQDDSFLTVKGNILKKNCFPQSKR